MVFSHSCFLLYRSKSPELVRKREQIIPLILKFQMVRIILCVKEDWTEVVAYYKIWTKTSWTQYSSEHLKLLNLLDYRVLEYIP